MGASYLSEKRLQRSIAAIATAPGAGAIGIVRVSGRDALEIGARMFSSPRRLQRAASHTIHFGRVLSQDGETVDSVLALVMRAPGTYTGEDTVEFHTHGGPVQVNRVLRACIETGAEAALPGEFTFRAFINGKIDLTQAESVADLIGSGTDAAARAALRQSDGGLRVRLEQLRQRIVELRSRCEASIDFVDDDIPEAEQPFLLKELGAITAAAVELADSYRYGRLLREGAQVVLSGPPNVGKSSLFNAILRTERAIVTEIPGTTRDALTEAVDIGGIPVVLADTAGIRSSGNKVEREGVRISEEYRQAADLVLELRDAAAGTPTTTTLADDRTMLIFNKIDLLSEDDLRSLQTHRTAFLVSAKTGDGIADLCEAVADKLGSGWFSAHEFVLTRSRHYLGLSNCLSCLNRAASGLQSKAPLEVIALELREACVAVDELVGKVYDDEVLNRIFGEFCIGK
jgi:tRNA modification GTPase